MARVASRVGRKYHFVLGEDALPCSSVQVNTKTGSWAVGFAILVVGKWPCQCIELGVTSTAPAEISKDRAERKSHIAHSWTLGGAGKFFSVGGWNCKSSGKSKQDLENWPGLAHNDLLEVRISKQGSMHVSLNGASVGTWQSGIPVDRNLWPLVELHAQNVCVKLMSLASSPCNSAIRVELPFSGPVCVKTDVLSKAVSRSVAAQSACASPTNTDQQVTRQRSRSPRRLDEVSPADAGTAGGVPSTKLAALKELGLTVSQAVGLGIKLGSDIRKHGNSASTGGEHLPATGETHAEPEEEDLIPNRVSFKVGGDEETTGLMELILDLVRKKVPIKEEEEVFVFFSIYILTSVESPSNRPPPLDPLPVVSRYLSIILTKRCCSKRSTG